MFQLFGYGFWSFHSFGKFVGKLCFTLKNFMFHINKIIKKTDFFGNWSQLFVPIYPLWVASVRRCLQVPAVLHLPEDRRSPSLRALAVGPIPSENGWNWREKREKPGDMVISQLICFFFGKRCIFEDNQVRCPVSGTLEIGLEKHTAENLSRSFGGIMLGKDFVLGTLESVFERSQDVPIGGKSKSSWYRAVLASGQISIGHQCEGQALDGQLPTLVRLTDPEDAKKLGLQKASFSLLLLL